MNKTVTRIANSTQSAKPPAPQDNADLTQIIADFMITVSANQFNLRHLRSILALQEFAPKVTLYFRLRWTSALRGRIGIRLPWTGVSFREKREISRLQTRDSSFLSE